MGDPTGAVLVTGPHQAEDLLSRPRPALLVDSGPPQNVLTNLRALFFLLQPGGQYRIEGLGPSGAAEPDAERRRLVARLAALATGADSRPDERDPVTGELAESIAGATFSRGHITVVKGPRHLTKLREWSADEVLTERYGDAWGAVLERRPATTFTSRARVVGYGDGPIHGGGPRQLQIPERKLREYRDVTVASRQLVFLGDYVLPDTFRHLHQPVLGHRRLRYAGPYAARPGPGHRDPGRRLEGTYYLLDTEHPGHFGHVLTEVLARVWGWPAAQRHDPGVRVLLTGRGKPARLPDFERVLLEAAGVRLDDVEVLQPRETVTVERLIAATPQFENPYFCDPDLAEVWSRIRESLGSAAPGLAPGPARIFVSRAPGARRRCHQHDEVERFFAERNFHVFRPETLPFVEQARLFAGAEVVAGYGGSGMFTMLLAPQARVLLINGDGYNAENEHLIAAVNGNELHYFWGRSDLRTADGHSQLDAARSDFSFDLTLHRDALERAIGAAAVG